MFIERSTIISCPYCGEEIGREYFDGDIEIFTNGRKIGSSKYCCSKCFTLICEEVWE